MQMRILTSLQLFFVCLLGFSFCVSADVLDPLVDIKPNFSNYNFYGSKDSPNYIAGTYWKNEWVPTPEIGPGTGYLKTTYEPLSLRNNHYYGVNRLLTMTYTAYQLNGYRPSTDVGSVYDGELYGSTSLLQGGYTEISDATVNATSDLVASDGGGSIDISNSQFNGQTDLTVFDGGTLNVDNLSLGSFDQMTQLLNKVDSLLSSFLSFDDKFFWFYQNFLVLTDFFTVVRSSQWVQVNENIGYSLPKFSYVLYSYTDEQVQGSLIYFFGSFPVIVQNYFDSLSSFFTAHSQQFYNWFYPLQSEITKQYWRFWNTDTQQQEATSLAGLWYNISWYLGQMYLMNSWDLGDTGLQQSADELDQTIQDYDKAEKEIFGTVNGYLDQFLPDPGDFASLKAIGWIGDFLQQSFVSLGAYSIPITIALVLGVCMQFLGYFKFKV